MEVGTAEEGVSQEASADGGAAAVESGTSSEDVASGLTTAAVLVVASLASGPRLVYGRAVPSAKTDVLEESGETGTSGMLDMIEISVPQQDTISASCNRCEMILRSPNRFRWSFWWRLCG